MNTYLCRPLVEHVPKMENAEITQCSICGRDCWKRPELEAEVKKIYDQVIETCTECAIKYGGQNGTQI